MDIHYMLQGDRCVQAHPEYQEALCNIGCLILRLVGIHWNSVLHTARIWNSITTHEILREGCQLPRTYYIGIFTNVGWIRGTRDWCWRLARSMGFVHYCNVHYQSNRFEYVDCHSWRLFWQRDGRVESIWYEREEYPPNGTQRHLYLE
jgi:hypothetical protein